MCGSKVWSRPTICSERVPRPAVLWRKGSFGTDTAAGSRFAERLLTVAASCRQQGRQLLPFLVAAVEPALPRHTGANWDTGAGLSAQEDGYGLQLLWLSGA
jgi:hypothetical protein